MDFQSLIGLDGLGQGLFGHCLDLQSILYWEQPTHISPPSIIRSSLG